VRAVKAYSVPADPAAAAGFWRDLGFDWVMLAPACLEARTGPGAQPKGASGCDDLQSAKAPSPGPGIQDLLAAIRAEGLRWSAIEPVFLADDATVPGELSLGADGEPLVDDWVRFACPSKPGPRRRVADRIRAHAALRPDGMSLDFLRFWQFWETVRPGADPATLRSGCHCPDCERERSGGDVEAWRCGVVTDAAASLSSLVRDLLPGARLGIHTVPWLADEYGGAVTRLLGQDIAALAPFADYLTPMGYHHMTGRDTEWVGRVARDQAKRTGLPVVPCVQTAPAYVARNLDVPEFGEALVSALASGTGGIAVYRHEDLAADPAKAEVVKSILGQAPKPETHIPTTF